MKVKIELTDEYVRQVAELKNIPKLMMEFHAACFDYVKKKPKKTRPMTDVERLAWSINNKSSTVYWEKSIKKMSGLMAKDCNSTQILMADHYIDGSGKIKMFEVEE